MSATPASKDRSARHARQGGSALLEFAFLLIFTLYFAGALVQLGRYMWCYQVVQKSARDGARYLSRVPMSERANAARNLEMRRNALAIVKAGIHAGNVWLDPLVTVACEPTPLCQSIARPATVAIFANVQVIDMLWFGTWESVEDGNAWWYLDVRGHAYFPYVGA
jgi:hypothetical protein